MVIVHIFPSLKEHSLTFLFRDVLTWCERLSHFQNFFKAGTSWWKTVCYLYSDRFWKHTFCLNRQDTSELPFLFLCSPGFLLWGLWWRRGWEFGEGLRRMSDCFRSIIFQFLNTQILCTCWYLWVWILGR